MACSVTELGEHTRHLTALVKESCSATDIDKKLYKDESKDPTILRFIKTNSPHNIKHSTHHSSYIISASKLEVIALGIVMIDKVSHFLRSYVCECPVRHHPAVRRAD